MTSFRISPPLSELEPDRRSIVGRGLAALALLFLILCIHPGEGQAVLIDSGDGTGNITAPANDPGFDHVADIKGLAGVYLQNGWVLTAYHVGSGDIELKGVTYDFVPGSFQRVQTSLGDTPDLALIKLAGDPELPAMDIATQTPPTNAELILIGNGRSRGAALTWSGLGGWNYAYPFIKRWGTNRINASVTLSNTESFYMEFNAPGDSTYTTHEAIATVGDSGGGVFQETGSGWVLAGTMFAVSKSQNQPADTALYTNATYAVDVATYRAGILSVISVPDCANGLDDDLDGQIDAGGDPGCDNAADTSERSSALKCDNGIDDDTDGLIDYPDDPYCTSSTTASEAPEVPLLNVLSTLIVISALIATGLQKTIRRED
ncbi:MAG: trypsin-like peptidase domain-containing protein [Myxococcota bacterium]|nr:trypsin-like peptidase domain-containing protein [Myxococcota bacterium]